MIQDNDKTIADIEADRLINLDEEWEVENADTD